MNDKVVAFRVGVVVVAASVLATLLIIFFGSGQSLLQGTYTVCLRFPRAPGVTVETPVRKNGVLIGRIKSVELFDDHVDLEAQIDNHRKLRSDEVARIKTASLLGDAVVEFVPPSTRDASAAANEYVQHGDLLADGLVASDPLQVLTNLEGKLEGTIDSFKSAADGVTVLTTNLNQAFGANDDRIGRILSQTEVALESFNRMMGTLDEFVGDPQFKVDMKRSLHDLPKLFGEVQLTMQDARQAMATFERMGAKAERNLDNIEKFTEPLGENGRQLIADLGRAAQNLDQMTSQLSVVATAINDSDGTLGRLIHDDELYSDIRETVRNLNQSSRQIEPILRDFRIFSDRMGRDPGGELRRALLDSRPPGARIKYGPNGIPFPSSPRREENTAPYSGRR
ncbi:MAG: hypothetical protein CMJ64_18645 [Planctomycetaceae bacterium]|nr:hypothetical protein [Planctomycetaceae bacterium]